MACCFGFLRAGNAPLADNKKKSSGSIHNDVDRRTKTVSDVDISCPGGVDDSADEIETRERAQSGIASFGTTRAELAARERKTKRMRSFSAPAFQTEALKDAEDARRQRSVSNHMHQDLDFSIGAGIAGEVSPQKSKRSSHPAARRPSWSAQAFNAIEEGAAALGLARPKYVLCTGGAGYIGSHTVVQLVNSGYRVAILDNLLNSSPKVMDRIKELTPAGTEVLLFEIDMLDDEAMNKMFAEQRFDGVIHFAGLKAVGESVAQPIWYYDNNLRGTINMMKAMNEHGCNTLVFSSSATVYLPSETPLDEDSPLGCSNPYGWTKFMIERMLVDAVCADSSLSVSILRYFNPVGAHESGRIGEAPSSYPNNLMPFIQQVAVGRRECLSIFGTDYNTPDGTGVRDYIHVEDLAAGHICALKRAFEVGAGCMIHNLGSGNGVSVKAMVQGFEAAAGKPIPVREVDRRPGDLATVVANASKAKRDFDWQTTRGVDDMCRSVWNWVSKNPYGYDAAPEGATEIALTSFECA